MDPLQGTVSVQDILAYLDRDSYIGLADLCEYLSVEERTARDLIKRGLPCYRLSHKLIRFKRSEVDRWILKFREVQAVKTAREVQLLKELLVKARTGSKR